MSDCPEDCTCRAAKPGIIIFGAEPDLPDDFLAWLRDFDRPKDNS